MSSKTGSGKASKKAPREPALKPPPKRSTQSQVPSRTRSPKLSTTPKLSLSPDEHQQIAQDFRGWAQQEANPTRAARLESLAKLADNLSRKSSPTSTGSTSGLSSRATAPESPGEESLA